MSKSKRRKGPVVKGVTAHAVRVSLGRKLSGEAVRLAEQLVAKQPTLENRVLLGEAIVMRLEAMVSGKVDAELAARLVPRLDELSADVEAAEGACLASQANRFRVLLLGDRISAESDPQLLSSVVDMAVRNPALLSRVSDELAGEIQAVLSGLRALEQGEHEVGLAAVASIGFRSPLAPWRLLIRGLADYYDGSLEQAIEAWRRLPADRPPRRIARVLLALESRTLEDDPPPSESALRRLQSATKESRSDSVADLRLAWVDEDHRRTVTEMGKLWRGKRDDPGWLQRLCDRVWSRLVSSHDPRAIEEMKRQLPPPHWDPGFKLASILSVLLCPHLHSPAELSEAAERLDGYFADLERNEQLSPLDRKALRAALAVQLADFYHGFHGFASTQRREPDWLRGRRAGFVKVAWQLVLRMLRRASEASPEWERPVELAETILKEFEDRAKNEAPKKKQNEQVEPELIAVLQRYAAAHPGRVDAWRRYGQALRRVDQPEESAKVLEKLEQMAPRDPWVRSAGWRHRMDHVGRLAIARKFDGAIRTIDELEKLRPEELPPFVLNLLRAAVEFKRKDFVAAEQQLDEARRAGIGKPALAMLMEVHATRMKLPADVKRTFRQLREEALKVKDPKAAAELARLMTPIFVSGGKYSGEVTHRRELIKFLQRCLTVKLSEWEPEFVRDFGVADFHLGENTTLAEAIYKKFHRSRARDPIILFLGPMLDECYAPIGSLRDAIEESALRPEVALPEEMIEVAQEEIVILENEAAMPLGFGRFDDDDDDLDDFDDLDEEDLGFAPGDMASLMGADPEALGRQIEAATAILEKELRGAKSQAEEIAIMKRAVEALPPVLQQILLAQLSQHAGIDISAVFNLDPPF